MLLRKDTFRMNVWQIAAYSGKQDVMLMLLAMANGTLTTAEIRNNYY